jgi:hypothetical protein
MGECYRIGRTADFKLLSNSVGWAQVKGSGFRDNAVRAHSWEDANFKHKKLSFPVTGRIGLTRSEGEYGRLIGNLAVHFCFAFTATLHQTPIKNMGEDYMLWEQKIKTLPEEEVVSLIMGAIKYSNRLQPMQYWDGEDYAMPPIDIEKDVRRAIGQSGHLSMDIFGQGFDVKGVIHVGANIGREYLEYSESNVDNVIIFETDTKYFSKLQEQVPDNYICYRMALSDYNGTITLKGSDDIGILTSVTTLDDIDFDRTKFNVLVISGDIDKDSLLRGATQTLKHIDIIHHEPNK